jgi:hypothetical protein
VIVSRAPDLLYSFAKEDGSGHGTGCAFPGNVRPQTVVFFRGFMLDRTASDPVSLRDIVFDERETDGAGT